MKILRSVGLACVATVMLVGAVAAPASAAAVTKVRIDMNGCNGDTAAPIDETTWEAAAPSGTVATVQSICALAFDATDTPVPGDVTLSIVSGPGHLTDATGAQDLGSSATASAGPTYSPGYVTSTLTGTTTLRATVGSVHADGSKAWTAGAARIVTLGAPTGQSSDVSRTITATVRDAYTNPVAGVTVTFTEAGVGRLDSPAQVVTGANGTAQATLARNADTAGQQSVSASIAPASTDCNRSAGDPAGAPAGVCTASTINTWTASATVLTIVSSPATGVWGTSFAIGGSLTAGGQPVPGRFISIQRRLGFLGDFHAFDSALSDNTGHWAFVDKPIQHVQYRAVFEGDDQVGSSQSGVATALVRVGIVLNAAPTHPAAGQVVTFSGRVLPEHPGDLVLLQQYSPTSGWHTITMTRLTPQSTYMLRVLKRTRGFLLFRAAFASDADHLWNVSINRRVDWT